MRPSNFSPANHPFFKQRQIYFSPDCHTVSWWGAMTAILSPSEATIFFTWPPSFLILRSRFHLAINLSPTQRNVPCIQLPTSWGHHTYLLEFKLFPIIDSQVSLWCQGQSPYNVN
jgi:hypothetical protein